MASAKTVREWVGGRVALPAKITSMGDRRAEMILWVELPELGIVGQQVEDPEDRQTSFGESLTHAMTAPLFGRARRPKRVRVADPALATELESFTSLDVRVGPTPELDEVMRSLGAFFGEPSYFTDPALTPEDVAQLFVAARPLWAARPWTLVEDHELIHVGVPSMGIDDGCLSIVGALDEVHGFVFFPSYDDFEKMTGGAVGEAPVLGEGLYFSFEPRDDLPENMREEAAEHGWPLPDEDAYPALMHLIDGNQVPVRAPFVKLATALTRALGSLALVHRDALEKFGDLPVRESYSEPDGPDVVLTVPHPLFDDEDAWSAPRAGTLDGDDNPYDLPLEPEQLASLVALLEPFTLHRVLGLFCAAATVPQMLSPSVWLGDIMRHVQVASDAQARSLLDGLMIVYNHVLSTFSLGVDVEGFVPEPNDVDACEAWARGYSTLLRMFDPAELDKQALDAGFSIQALAGEPRMLEILDKLRGKQSRESMLARFRESMADDAAYLFDCWAYARSGNAGRPLEGARPMAPVETIRREAAKVGRNDPCPCGSGKKYKKCCATE